MNNSFQHRTGAKGALLDIYEWTIRNLQKDIRDLRENELVRIRDANTTDENCRSIQTVLTHVVHAGYGYAVAMQNRNQGTLVRPDKILHTDTRDYLADLDRLFEYTENVFESIREDELEEYVEERKMKTNWGQHYDIEQLMEHAIVHILRHHRQILKFINF